MGNKFSKKPVNIEPAQSEEDQSDEDQSEEDQSEENQSEELVCPSAKEISAKLCDFEEFEIQRLEKLLINGIDEIIQYIIRTIINLDKGNKWFNGYHFKFEWCTFKKTNLFLNNVNYDVYSFLIDHVGNPTLYRKYEDNKWFIRVSRNDGQIPINEDTRRVYDSDYYERIKINVENNKILEKLLLTDNEKFYLDEQAKSSFYFHFYIDETKIGKDLKNERKLTKKKQLEILYQTSNTEVIIQEEANRNDNDEETNGNDQSSKKHKKKRKKKAHQK